MTMRSAIYAGNVVHARHRPARHTLSYQVFSLYLDLDEIDALDASLRFFGRNRRALFSFHDADHGALDGTPLKDWALEQVRAAGIDTQGLSVGVLCYPRILGYVFNPLTVYFCARPDGEIAAILYEVCNTFHERHTYVIAAQGEGASIRQSVAKAFYVSPFVPMDCTYHFHIDQPGQTVAVRINETDGEGPLLYAAFSGRREALTDGQLLRTFLRYPLMTVKIMAGIHVEALRLWLKGLEVFRHQPADRRVARTIGDPRAREPVKS